MLGLQVLELSEKPVVFAIRKTRRVENVILVRGAVKRFPQLRGSLLQTAGVG